ncbi:MAG: thioredoxin domain-containing protein [Deltaproteobacteria bacterium]|nr:thioredoxin domain-containing protein [Deltaproteobacteria bacterium]
MSKAAERGYNRLKYERSPYLLQHAANPVDWYPWSAEAFERARPEDRPVIISIGYSSCHWCHVMERESFEDAATARIMNEEFVCIKVDREERPDLDSLYMKAVQAMTGQGGWPLTVFATPAGEPFFGGTYFPPEASHGLPAFKEALYAAARAYRENRARVGAATEGLGAALAPEAASAQMELDAGVSRAAFEAAELFYDPVYGGFGSGVKFPHAMFLKFLLKYHERTGEPRAPSMVEAALLNMADGAICDHAGGGFHRYSVNAQWSVPHFEKMLYDNALLAELYAMAYKAAGRGYFRDVSLDTLAWMSSGLQTKGGGFSSAIDADSDGGEGAYYVWGYEELREALAGCGAEEYAGYFSVTPQGNYEGRNTLRINRRLTGAVPPACAVTRMKAALLAAREKRHPPHKDGKVIVA